MVFRAAADGDPAARRRWVVIAGVTALLLLDVILVVWALTRPDGNAVDTSGSAPNPPTSVSDSPSPDPSASPTASPSSPSAASVPTVPATRILAAVDDRTAWRATTGECPGATASPEFTTDAGATWTTTDATGPTGVTALQRIITSSVDVATMVGAAPDSCAPTLIRTYVRGDNYEEYPAEVADAWHIDPADRAVVVAPAGAIAAPCPAVVAIAPSGDDDAAVLCADGSIATTTDAGVTWTTPVAVPGAQAIAFTEGGYLVASLGGSECAGVAVRLVGPGADDTAATISERGCVPLAGDLSALAGQVALGAGGGAYWVWAGETIARSTDNGATWG